PLPSSRGSMDDSPRSNSPPARPASQVRSGSVATIRMGGLSWLLGHFSKIYLAQSWARKESAAATEFSSPELGSLAIATNSMNRLRSSRDQQPASLKDGGTSFQAMRLHSCPRASAITSST